MRQLRFLAAIFATILGVAAAHAQQPQQRIRIGGAVQMAQLETQVAPVYPDVARQARIQGIVRLDAIISKEGAPLSLEIISGHPLLQQSALQAVSQWRYKPTLLNGQPVEVVTTVDVVFTLDGSIGTPPPVVAPAVEIARLREAITQKPEDERLRFSLAVALMRNSEMDAAIATMRESVRLHPEDSQTHARLAQFLLNEKYDYDGAVAEYREALLRKPDDPWACASLARAHESVYDYGQAVQQYAECIRMRPEDLDGYRPLAAALYKKEKLERATSEFRKYAAMHPSPAEVSLRVAETFGLGNLPASLAQAAEALRIRPDYTEARELQARLEGTLLQQQQRILDLRQYVARNPDDGAGLLALAFTLHSAAGDHAAAFAVMCQGLKASPETEAQRLADEVVEAKGFDGAITELRQLARTYPNSASVRQVLALFLLKKGLAGEALEVAREAARLAPENRNTRRLLGQSLALTGDADGARQEMQAAAAISPVQRAPQINPDLAAIMGQRSQGAANDPVIANETSAIGAIRTLNTVLVVYNANFNRGYAPSLAALGPGTPASAQAANLIDASLASGTRNGYAFAYTAGPADPQGAIQSYTITASPQELGRTGRRFFFTDQSGIIRFSTSGPASASSPPIS